MTTDTNLFKFNPLPTLVYEVDSYQIVDVNETAIELYGFTKEEFLSKTILDLSQTEDTSTPLQSPDLKINKNNSLNSGVITQFNKKGEFIRVEIHGQKVIFNDKECVTVICQDVTLKEKILQSSQENQNLLDASLDVICSVDEDGKFIRVSAASNSQWGYSPEELIGTLYIDLVHPEDVEMTNQGAADIISGQNLTTFENRYIKKNGEVAINLWSARWDIESRIMYSVAHDGTERKQKEQMLIESESRFKALVQEGSDLIVILDRNNDYKYISPTSTHVLGITPEELLGRNPFEFIHRDDEEKVRKALIQVETQNRVQTEPFRLQNKEGEWLWMETVFTNLIDHPAINGIVANARDITAIKREEQKSKKLGDKLQEILDSITDGFYALDENWCFTYFNKEAENLLNRKNQEVLGKSLWEVFPAAEGTELEANYREVASSQVAQSFEYLYPGDNSWYELSTYPSNGGIASYFKNINEKKKASEELKKAYREKDNILESITDGFFAVDNDWTVTYWNRAAEEMLLKKRGEIVGKNLWKVYDDVVGTNFYDKYFEAKRTGKVVAFEEFYSTLNIWFEVTVYPASRGLSIYFKGITQRKRAELKILQANERFEKVAEATSDAIWDWNLEEGTYYRGKGFLELFDYEDNKVLQQNDLWKDHLHPGDKSEIQESLQSAINDPNKDYWKMEYRIINSSKDVRTVVEKGVIIRDDSGKATRMVGAITDITESKQHEIELKSLNAKLKEHADDLELSNEQLEQFAYIASHDLQEPLRMITSFLDQLERKYSDDLDDKAQKYIYYATDGAKRMKRIILDLLEYSRAGKINHEPEVISLNELLEEYQALRKKRIEENDVLLKIDELPEVIGQKTPLTQTIHSLLDNAIKYSKPDESPVIEIKVTEDDDSWIIQVEDNGIGIDNEFIDKIFVIFQRLHNRNEYEGTGIGLSVAKKNIESWGGRIWVESIPGNGSSFYFTIPKP